MNYMDTSDAAMFAETGASMVHCPRSHSYFNHSEFPLAAAKKNKIPICLGTDSLATVRVSKSTVTKLCLFAEMREFMRKYPDIAPREVLEMTTTTPAQALGLQGLAGTLSKGAFADLVVIRAKDPASDPYTTVVLNEDPHRAVMIDGAWVVTPPHLQS